jgi:hypothetical protein
MAWKGVKKTVTVTPTVTAGAYSSGQVVGGILTLSNALRLANGSGYLPAIAIRCKVTAFTGPVDAFVFSKLPTGTYTDNATFNLTATDAASLLGVRHLNDLTTSGTGPVALRAAFEPMPVNNSDTTPTTNLYVILVDRASVTFASTSDISLVATVDQD